MFIQSSGIVNLQQTTLPYPVYVFTGTTMWAIFMDTVNSPLQKTNAAKPMLAKINFPREALVLSGIHQTLFNAGIKIGVLLIALFFMGIFPGWGLLLFPLASYDTHMQYKFIVTDFTQLFSKQLLTNLVTALLIYVVELPLGGLS